MLAFGLQVLLVRSNFGRILLSIKQDEILAAAKGVDTARYRLAAFTIGSAIAGLGGALLGPFLRVVAPLSFDLLESINYVLIVVVGGAGYLAGPLLGVAVFIGIPEYLRIADEWRLVIFGALLVAIMLFSPQGLAGLAAGAVNRLRRTGGDEHGS